MTEHWQKLAAPFGADQVEFYPTAASREGDKALVVYYIDARAVMNRLDAVFGPAGWRDDYKVLPDGKHVQCWLTVTDPETQVTVTKSDVGEPSEGLGDEMKGAFSSAFKRTGVKFGIGRDLYGIEGIWVAAKKVPTPRGDKVVLTTAGQREAHDAYEAHLKAAPRAQERADAPKQAAGPAAEGQDGTGARELGWTELYKRAAGWGYDAQRVKRVARELGYLNLQAMGPADRGTLLREVAVRHAREAVPLTA